MEQSLREVITLPTLLLPWPQQRVRCTEAKLIWSFDDKSATFTPPAHTEDSRMEGRKERQRKTNRGG